MRIETIAGAARGRAALGLLRLPLQAPDPDVPALDLVVVLVAGDREGCVVRRVRVAPAVAGRPEERHVIVDQDPVEEDRHPCGGSDTSGAVEPRAVEYDVVAVPLAGGPG